MADAVSSKSPFEAQFGFCRARRVGDRILVAGTAPIGADGATAAPDDAAGQARRCFEIIVAAVRRLGGDPTQIVRTRMFLTDVEDWAAVGAVHGEFFGAARPVATMVAVAGLIDPSWRIEVEAEADLAAAPPADFATL